MYFKLIKMTIVHGLIKGADKNRTYAYLDFYVYTPISMMGGADFVRP